MGTPVSSNNKSDRHAIIYEKLMKATLSVNLSYLWYMFLNARILVSKLIFMLDDVRVI